MSTSNPFPTLTDRQRQVAMMIASGATNKEIAKKLGISLKTVDTHRGKTIKVLGLRNNVDVARLAIRSGWMEA